MNARALLCSIVCAALLGGLAACTEDSDNPGKSVRALASAPSGAIFTTLPDGTRVNANIYASKNDVYLDGGPNGTQTAAAALDDGDYVFQVTDPSGKVLLSTDAASCRVVRVEGGVITHLLDWDGSGIEPSDFSIHAGNDACHRSNGAQSKHNTNPDSDNPGIDDIVVQLMPYDDTPNPGGVYKAWMTRVQHYVCDLDVVDCGYAIGTTDFHGFVPAASKTDNFKVKTRIAGKTYPTITVHKYCDAQCDGLQDPGDACLSGVDISVSNAAGTVLCHGQTVGGFFFCLLPDIGTYTVSESLGGSMFVCGASVDNGLGAGPTPQGAVTSVTVAITQTKQDAIVSFGNSAADGEITAEKICANDGSTIAGWPVALSGTAVDGTTVEADGTTPAGFSGLKAGSYTITEGTVAGYVPIGPTTCDVTLTVDTALDPAGNPQCTAGSQACTFTNAAVGNVGARTPGFWCSQVQRSLGYNVSENAACYQRLLCEYGSIQATLDNAFDLWTVLGGASALFDLDGSGGVEEAEAEIIFCPQAGDAEHNQCRRQLYALLMNVANEVTEATNDTCGSACSDIGTGTGQGIVVDGELSTVGAFLDSAPKDGTCDQATWDVAKGVNENTITLTATCPPLP